MVDEQAITATLPSMSSDTEFDAVAAAKELDDLLAEPAKDDSYIASLEADVEELNVLVATKDAQLVKANARADQAHAEIEAASKRLAAASAKELEQRTRALLEGFLPIVDDLDRAIAAAKVHSPEVAAGLELVRRSMLARFARLGVNPVPALGEPFDPSRHEAIAIVPITDAAQDNRVIDVMREGYSIGDDTLRAAGVAVGKLAR